ncbi:hypothetical protein XthCFBP4691_13480 [Xanthomonas theicola]|uniref:Uncharacterized protein n=1 Tax=Xanthomonas theicola TaxID=56464 RepID=A0A2S6ZDD1_9XANT|nr:hypothetical protein XthCFBP4691_13480 [Xanthomonas theicola]
MANGVAHATARNVFRPPLSAGGTDDRLRRHERRHERRQRMAQIVALGAAAALAAVALIAWRRTRR